jgi:hypothetical protein
MVIHGYPLQCYASALQSNKFQNHCGCNTRLLNRIRINRFVFLYKNCKCAIFLIMELNTKFWSVVNFYGLTWDSEDILAHCKSNEFLYKLNYFTGIKEQNSFLEMVNFSRDFFDKVWIKFSQQKSRHCLKGVVR